MRFGGWKWLEEGLVEEIPVLHLGHRTAHSEELRVESRSAWGSDRRAFRRKWRRILQASKMPIE
jgi:hypothetical protein